MKAKIAASLCALIGLFCIIWPRFASPELTETQLLIEYWDLFLQGILWMGLGYWMVRK